jgi:hypothetical protein
MTKTVRLIRVSLKMRKCVACDNLAKFELELGVVCGLGRM